MMVEGQDLEVLKDIPGYKAILRALIKSQIQHLVEQLSTHTEEECLLLSASLSDGSLSHLGSDYGKQFLDDCDVKKQFLGFCLKKQLKKQTTNTETVPINDGSSSSFTTDSIFPAPVSRPSTIRPGPMMSVRQRPSTSPYSRYRPLKPAPVRSSFPSPSCTVTSQVETSVHEVGNQSTFDVKEEQTDIPEINKSVSVFSDFNASQEQLDSTNSHSQNTGSLLFDNSFTNSDQVNVKQEPSIEEEPELEITGIEANPTELKNWVPVNEANAGNLFSDVTFSEEDESQETTKFEKRPTRRRLTLGVKYRAIMEFERGQKSKTAIANMFQIPNNTFTGWLKQAELIKTGYLKFGPKRHTMRQMHHNELENAVLKWFKDAREKNRPINGPIVMEKAKIIAKQLGLKEFKPSTGWLHNFKKRNQISFK